MNSELPGIRNGHFVDEHLYRGGDVSEFGIQVLKEAGITLIICLKNAKQDSQDEIDTERRLAFAYGIEFCNAPMDSSGVFGYDDGWKVPAILALIAKTEGRVFIHCHKGSDRTGVVVACYRITDHWSADQALNEMKRYGASYIHFGMRSFVRQFARKAE